MLFADPVNFHCRFTGTGGGGVQSQIHIQIQATWLLACNRPIGSIEVMLKVYSRSWRGGGGGVWGVFGGHDAAVIISHY